MVNHVSENGQTRDIADVLLGEGLFPDKKIHDISWTPFRSEFGNKYDRRVLLGDFKNFRLLKRTATRTPPSSDT